MKKYIIAIVTIMVLFPQYALSRHAVTILNPQTSGAKCSTQDYNIFQGYRAFWSYVIQKKPSGYPGYWALVPETWMGGYTSSVCKNVVEQGYGTINLKKK